MKNPRVKTVGRKDVFELLLSIQSRAGFTPGVEGQIAFLRELDAIVDRFIYADNPFALELQSRPPVTINEVSDPAHGYEVGGRFFKASWMAMRYACGLAGWVK